MEPLILIAAAAMLTRGGSVPEWLREASRAFVWPMPILEDAIAEKYGCHKLPRVSSGWGTDRGDHKHVGVDVMYARRRHVIHSYPYPDYGSKGFTVPPDTMVRAAGAGVIWKAGFQANGFYVIIDHGVVGPFATYYTHMRTLAVPHVGKHDRGKIPVAPGQPLGVCGFSPIDPRKVTHLHFEIRQNMERFDPEPIMKRWRMVK